MKLNADELCEAVDYIEEHLVGWWWTIHLNKDTFEITLGPDLSASAFDRQFLKTREGDSGFTHAWDNTVVLKDAARDLVGIARDKLLHFTPEMGKHAPILEPPKPVRRNRPDVYGCSRFLTGAFRNITTISKRAPVRQVMVGSCWRSADASIRTKTLSWDADMTDPDANIGNALHEAVWQYTSAITC